MGSECYIQIQNSAPWWVEDASAAFAVPAGHPDEPRRAILSFPTDAWPEDSWTVEACVVTPRTLSWHQGKSSSLVSSRAMIVVSSFEREVIDKYVRAIFDSHFVSHDLGVTYENMQKWFRGANEEGVWYEAAVTAPPTFDVEPIQLVKEADYVGGPRERIMDGWFEFVLRIESQVDVMLGFRLVTLEALGALADQYDRPFVLAHRGTLIVNSFHWQNMKTDVARIVHSCVADRPTYTLARLGRYFWLLDEGLGDLKS